MAASRKKAKKPMEQPARDLLASQGAAAAIAWLESQPDPAAVASAFDALARHAYTHHKDIGAMLAIAQAGIEYALRTSLEVAEDDADLAFALSGHAKTINYNLSANTWPGWADEGIAITPEQQALGYQAAHKNLELAEILDKGDLALGRAYWLIGAHELAAANPAAARAAFEQAGRHAAAAGQPGEARLNEGYAHLAELLADPSQPAARQGLRAALADLPQYPQGEFFARQLQTAGQVFQPSEGA